MALPENAIKLFTIVKDETDIVAEWVHYHGQIFGYSNLYIIDNMSTDGTYEKLLNLKQNHGCSVVQMADYKLKGEYMSRSIGVFCSDKTDDGNYKTPIAYPLDIDEFIACYDKETHTVSCDKSKILAYFNDVIVPKIINKEHVCFKTNYVISKIISDTPNNCVGYNNAVLECSHGTYSSTFGDNAKTFFSSKYIIENNIQIDHGNHFYTRVYFMTDLVLIHYHCRSYEQMVKKIYNNVNGFNYPVNNVKLLHNYLNSSGFHHVKNRIDMLNGTYKLCIEQSNETTLPSETHISLAPIIECMTAIIGIGNDNNNGNGIL